MDEKQFEARIQEMGGPIICGPSESCKMRIIRVMDDEGMLFKATAWGKKSEELHVGGKVLIGMLPPVNPSSKINDYEVLNTK